MSEKELINDEYEESVDSDEEIGRGGQKRDRDEELELEEDDYDLLEENWGTKIQRKKKLRRVRRLDDDDDDEEETGQAIDERRLIEEQIFNDDDDDDIPGGQRQHDHIRQHVQRGLEQIGSDESEDDCDQFIVDDIDPALKRQREKVSKYNDSAIQVAQEVFGTDFDYNDFANLDESAVFDDEDLDDEEYEEIDEEMESTQVRRRSKKKSIYEIYEPAELERSHLTEEDNIIRNTDLPERFQLRSTPITDCSEVEIREEAEWIYRNIFEQKMITKFSSEGTRQPLGGEKAKYVVVNIQHVLQFIRKDFLEVPFIAFYRKEYYSPELEINDLWLIYKWDEKWCQLQERKQNLLKMYEDLKEYQYKLTSECPEDSLPDSIRRLTDEDFKKLQNSQSIEEFNDCFLNFQLNYSTVVPLVKNHKFQQKQEERKRKREEKQSRLDAMNFNDEVFEESAIDSGNETEAEEMEYEEIQLTIKRISIRKNPYTLFVENGIGKVVNKFGLSAEQFGENLAESYSIHELKQESQSIEEIAQEFVCKKFDSPEKVIEAAIYMLGQQIACDISVRKTVRKTFYDRAVVNAHCTKRGAKEIDENHPCYTFRYLKNKPLASFDAEQFLLLYQATKDGFMEMAITIDKKESKETYIEEIKTLFMKDEYSNYILKWNSSRHRAIEIALNKYILPNLVKEVTNKIICEAQFVIAQAISRKMSSLISMGPFVFEPTKYDAENDDDFHTQNGLRIMGLAFDPNNKEAGFAALIDNNGEITDYIKLEFFLLKRDIRFLQGNDKVLRDKDTEKLQRFIRSKKPHVIALGCDSLVTRSVMEALEEIVRQLHQNHDFPLIPIEYMDSEMSLVFMNSKRAASEFPNYPLKLRQAISLARRLQDPLIAFSQLCSLDEDILCLKLHPLQEHLPKEEHQAAIYQEFIIRVNHVGVDLNRCLLYNHTSPLVQFIGGFGPRKATFLLRALKKQNPPLLENRTQLVQNCQVGKVVFINCAGFIKIDTTQMADSGTETYIEVLDSTRVHPEAYDWARKMAVDALDYDEEDDENSPAQALEEILMEPSKLRDLELDEFAKEIQKQGIGLKQLTLYDIRNELTDRYADRRVPYQKPSMEEIFSFLTGETKHTLYIGKIVLVKVLGIMRKKPLPEIVNSIHPFRENGIWCCPLCYKKDFYDVGEVFNHLNSRDCPGQAFAVRCKLEGGLFGMIPLKFLSDREVKDPESRVQIGMNIHSRVLKVIIDRFTVELTCRSSDLNDEACRFKKPLDSHYDEDYQRCAREREGEKKRKAAQRPRYLRRAIVHPNFQNIDYLKCEKLLSDSQIGHVVIRPSSKGDNFLALSFKVFDGIHSHVEIREEKKSTPFALGSKLFIGHEEYEDLDEIIARFVQPIAGFIRDLISFKYFKSAPVVKKDFSNVNAALKEEKEKVSTKIPYFVSPLKDIPGLFVLSYLHSQQPKHEFISVTPEGYILRGNTFKSLNSLFRWFKAHCGNL